MKYLKILVVLTFSVLTGMSVAQAFTDNPNTPPTCPTSIPGCNEPINVSGSTQTKTGTLLLGGNLFANGEILVNTDSNGNNGLTVQNSSGRLWTFYTPTASKLNLWSNGTGDIISFNGNHTVAMPGVELTVRKLCFETNSCATEWPTQSSGGVSGGAVDSVSGGSGISVTPTTGNVMVTNTAPNRFGGMYTETYTRILLVTFCSNPNPMTGSCSCPAGFNNQELASWGDFLSEMHWIHSCWK